MRIGLLNLNPVWGGGEVWFAQIACALADRGHDLVMVARRRTRLLELFDDIKGTAGPLEDMAAAFEQTKPDLVVCNSSLELRMSLKVVGDDPDVSIVLFRGIDRPLHDNVFRRRSWRRVSAILVPSEATALTVHNSLPWYPRERIRRIYNPVAFNPALRMACNEDSFRIGAIGRLVRQKGFDVLLAALARLGTEIDWRCEIAGDGVLRRRLERRAAHLGLADRVRFLGHIEDPADFYAQQDVIISPSRYEGFGYVLAEAALAGLPVIATAVSSNPEIVEDGRTGILVPLDDEAAIAEALLQLSSRPNRLEELGEHARLRARERFDPEQIYEELGTFFQSLSPVPSVGPVSSLVPALEIDHV